MWTLGVFACGRILRRLTIALAVMAPLVVSAPSSAQFLFKVAEVPAGAMTLLRKSGQVDYAVFRSVVSSNFAGLT